jgi:predicted DCC family thiol-disulfide oxidoreductase YuxK
MREPIVVFDTNCVLCSGMVAFILAHERNRALRFVGAWSDEGLALAARHHFSKSDLDQTFLVLSGDAALSRSDAGVEISEPTSGAMALARRGPHHSAASARRCLPLRRATSVPLVWAARELRRRAAE